MIGFELEEKTTPKRYQNLEFQTLKDRTSTPTILPYKNSPWLMLAMSYFHGAVHGYVISLTFAG